MYAVWHSGFMQKMAMYQIKKLRIFSGFFIPYLGDKERRMLKKRGKLKKGKRVAVNVAILGGGDVVFPILLAGVVLAAWGLTQALIIAVGATIALGFLFFPLNPKKLLFLYGKKIQFPDYRNYFRHYESLGVN